MISKNLIKFVHSLELKKNRNENKLFVAEGPKVVGDLLAISKAHTIIATEEWLQSNSARSEDIVEVSEEELSKVSFLQHPQHVLGVFTIPEYDIDTNIINKELCIALDGVQDPGNLGTIIRIADWFGITHIFCSPDTANAYNPKVVQATMGSIAHVKIMYCPLKELIESLQDETPIYGTMLDGDDIYSKALLNKGLVIMGNEGKGISAEISQKVKQRLLIPNYPKMRKSTDSLNVAIATAIVCAEFRRNAK